MRENWVHLRNSSQPASKGMEYGFLRRKTAAASLISFSSPIMVLALLLSMTEVRILMATVAAAWVGLSFAYARYSMASPSITSLLSTSPTVVAAYTAGAEQGSGYGLPEIRLLRIRRSCYDSIDRKDTLSYT